MKFGSDTERRRRMAASKYGKYLIPYDGEQKFPLGRILAQFDNKTVKGSNYYFLHWVMPETDLTAEGFQVGHPPHRHEAGELLFHIGANPRDPMDLGAEIEFHIGEEMEKHVINKTSIIFLPAGLVHGPWKPLKITRPFLFLEVNQELKLTSQFFPELLPREQRERVDWEAWEQKNYQ
jgi:hypothetical protein